MFQISVCYVGRALKMSNVGLTYTEVSKSKLLDTSRIADLSSVYEALEHYQKVEYTPKYDDVFSNEDEVIICKKWISLLSSFADDFLAAKKYSIMRLAYSIATSTKEQRKKQVSAPKEGAPFEVTLDGRTITFSDLSINNSKQISRKERNQYEALLTHLAEEHQGSVSLYDQFLISRVIGNMGRAKNLGSELGISSSNSSFSRKEAIEAGHAIGLTYFEIQWLLIRCFEYDEILKPLSSEDLIDAYGFFVDASLSKVNQLKQRFHAKCIEHQIESTIEQKEGYTRALNASFEQLVSAWKQEEDPDDAFLAWLLSQQPYLDRPSQTGIRSFRNLLLYGYRLSLHGSNDSNIPDSLDELKNAVISIGHPDSSYYADHIDQVTYKLFSDLTPPKKSNNTCYFAFNEYVHDSFSEEEARRILDAWQNDPKQIDSLFYRWIMDLLQSDNNLHVSGKKADEKDSVKENHIGTCLSYFVLHISETQYRPGGSAGRATALKNEIDRVCALYPSLQPVFDKTVADLLQYSMLTYMADNSGGTEFGVEDTTKLWQSISMLNQSKPKPRVAGRQSSNRERIIQLFLGEVQVEKADLCLLIWFVFSTYWVFHPLKVFHQKNQNDPAIIAETLEAFIFTCDVCCKTSLFIPFYINHLAEQGLLQAIVFSYFFEDGTPNVTYTEMCEALRSRRE